MSYDSEFYRRYRKYLEEKTVRRNHDRMFELFARMMSPDMPAVLELGGCVHAREYATYDKRHTSYVGIDLNNNSRFMSDGSRTATFMRGDYTALDFRTLRLPFTPNAFISLFSVEISLPPEKRYALYENIFRGFPDIRYALVTGFLYNSQRHKHIVGETGGIQSYQTIEDPAAHISNLFTEMRVHLWTPSDMFSPKEKEVCEVWKMFVRT